VRVAGSPHTDPYPQPEEEVAAPSPAPEPVLPRGKDFNGKPFGALRYAPISGRPIVAGVAPGDVIQGNLGDCFFLSSLVALAGTHPEIIERALSANANGTYTVTFHGPGGRPTSVTVDGTFPENARNEQTFGRGSTKSELWPAIFEKAYAQWKGGYSVLDGGGFAKDALRELTGKAARSRTLSNLSSDAAWKLVADAVRSKQPVVTGTPLQRELVKRTGRADMAGLIDEHAYALVGAYEKGGKRFVKLFTPLSPADAGYSKTAPRTLELPFEKWKRYFDDVAVGTV